MTSVAVAGRADLTDAQLARLVPLLPRPKKAGRPPMWTKRQLTDGIRSRTRVGCPWRDVPPQYGSWSAVYGLFRRWQRGGVWWLIVKMLQVFADATGSIGWQVSVDSTIMRAHQHAAGARRDGAAQAEPPGGDGELEPADHGLGRSRGGWTTKLHLACEQGCRVLSLLVTPGQAADSPQFTTVLDEIEVAKIGGPVATARVTSPAMAVRVVRTIPSLNVGRRPSPYPTHVGTFRFHTRPPPSSGLFSCATESSCSAGVITAPPRSF
ncbi:Transposase [Nocardia farcinica]|uniref:Transposase and inactivated derivatives n=1 Tax=Nocardia farcinica TaxID=37329 RepID=A0A0H5P7N5_NOCFR|nr:IS5 family transposase [Nocardia farcinica]CRY83369.1 Transposase and inactivated derivatives [Nocardia farcinica]SIT19353.1 Transposase [Nocardia farcinica]